MNHEQIFTPLYGLRSGPGSTVEHTSVYRDFLSDFIRYNNIRSVLDLGCGDMEVMSNVNLHGAEYLGVDVIAGRISDNAKRFPTLKFEHRDLMTYEIPEVDLVICKDVIQHWTNQEIRAFLVRLMTAPVKVALITNCNYGSTVNLDISTGGWRPIDLTAPPFEIGRVVCKWGAQRFGGEKDTVLLSCSGALHEL